MQLKNRVRTVVSTIVTTLLILPLFSAGFGPNVAHAATPAPAPASLIINEIHWGGSSAYGPNDQWIELYNTSSAAIDLNATPFTLLKDGVPLITLDHRVVAANGYFVVSKFHAANSSLTALSPRRANDNLVLSKTDTAYTLENETNAVVDTVTANLAGSKDASMSRVDPTANGTLAASWYTSTTIGKNFDGSVAQYGTPGTVNVELASPTNLVIDPTSPTVASVDNEPTITGQVAIGVDPTIPTEVRANYQRISTNDVKHSDWVSIIDPATGKFTIDGVTLPKDGWRISVTAQDAYGNQTSPVVITILDSPQNIYVVNKTATVYAPPTLDSGYATLTNAHQTILTGSVADPASLVVYINGNEYGEKPVDLSNNRFTVTVPLINDSLNKIEVRTKHGKDLSEPAIAEITQDSTAPVLDATKIKINANPLGTADSIQGLPGAANTAQLAEVYSDSAAVTLIGTAYVGLDGSFPAISIGDDQYSTVYIVLKDEAGNASAPVAIDVSSAIIPVTPPATVIPVYDGVGGNSGPVEPIVTIQEVKSTPPVVSSNTTVTPPKVETVAPTPTPTATPDETGEVKSESTEANRNWTPWIILIILIVLAILATAGYFYWFGAEEEAAAATTTVRGPLASKEQSPPKEKEKERNDKKPTNRPKRW